MGTLSSFHLGYFGEGPAERRERLRNLISRLSDDEIAQKLRRKEEDEKRSEDTKEVKRTENQSPVDD